MAPCPWLVSALVALSAGEEMCLLQLPAAPPPARRGRDPAPRGAAGGPGRAPGAGGPRGGPARAVGGYYRQWVHNFHDVQYAVDFEVGGQALRGIPDTGSFDVLVFGEGCPGCGQAGKYDSGDSGSYEGGEWFKEQSYGSGDVMAQLSTDVIKFGPNQARQWFWRGVYADMPILREASFNAVVGIGPPGATQKDAAITAKKSTAVVSGARMLGLPVPEAWSEAAVENAEFAEDMASKKNLLENLQVTNFSYCLKRQSGKEGYLIWNDNVHTQKPDLFQKAEVAGKVTWGLELAGVHLGSTSLGCGDGCAAIVDSGTSMIVAPSSVVEKAQEMLSRLNTDCSNLDDLPDLVFELGGNRYTLPPESYVGTVVNDLPAPLKKIFGKAAPLPHLECQLLLMTEDTMTDHGPLWILGMPFFREYYTTFHLGSNQKDRALYTARADSECNPAGPPGANARAAQRLREVDLSKVRVPRWAARAASAGSLSF